uniref:Myosin-binding protein C, fast-type n=1 Tax=Sarcophilus harrisii TaxID=9305 RepID=A0A7N4P6Y9_SARHA
MPVPKPAAKKPAAKAKDASKEPAPAKEAPAEEAPAAPSSEAPPEDQSPTAEEPTGIFLKKPETVSVEAGKDVVITAKVNGKELPGKPVIKWFKGKWLELGSKSGARFSFKETHDAQSNVRLGGSWGRWAVGMMESRGEGQHRGRGCSRGRGSSSICRPWVSLPPPPCSFPSHKPSCPEPEPPGSREVVEEKKKKKKDDDDLGLPPRSGAAWGKKRERDAPDGITDRGMPRPKKAKVEVKKSAAFTKKLDPAYQVDKGNKIKLVVEISDPDLPLKWYKNGQEIKPSSKYVFENVGKKRILTINKCTLADDAAYEVAVKDEKCFTELFVKEPPVLIITPLEDQQVFVGDRVEMMVEVSEEGAQLMWMKDDVEMTREDSYKARYRFKKDGKKHLLIFTEVTQEDRGRYKVMTNGGQCEAELIVEGKGASARAGLGHWGSSKGFAGVWKTSLVTRFLGSTIPRPPSRIHKLVIDDVRPEDEGDYTFVPDGFALTLSAKLNFLEIKIDYVPKQEPPKIHLDCSGKMSENIIVVVAGNKLRLDVAITGEPPPTVTWLKEDQVFSDTEGRVHLEQRPDNSSFVIEGAERADEARYTIKVTNPVGEDTASIFIKVVDVPDPPEAVRITSVGEDWAILVWEPPKYDGGQAVTGYLIERKKKGSQRWMKLNFEVFTETTYESTKMIEGVLYEMRVFAVNAIGVSQPSVNSKPFMPIAPTSEPLHLMVEDVTDTTTTLKWRPPDRIGAGGIDGYIVEYCLEGSEDWVAANTEPVERCGFTVKGLPTGARIFFRVVGVNIAGRSEPATLVQPVTIREIVQQPKIRLPRHLRQTYIRRVGEPINLVIPFQGKPRPQVTWTKDGAPLDTSRVNIRTSDFDTVFFVRQAARTDSGEYKLSVQIENMEDTAIIRIRVVGAGPAENVMVGGGDQRGWSRPRKATGTPIQKAKGNQGGEWFTVYEHSRPTKCTVADLIIGNEYYFRVYSENICGLSDSPGVSKNTAKILKTGITLKPLEFQEHDFRSAPKFLTPLLDRVVVAGYTAALYCAVRGYPKPKVVWMKNKMEIHEDPKFIMTNQQGILTLSIRRPSPFDGGTYSCRAVNELGEALAECKLEPGGLPQAVETWGHLD